MGEVKNTMLITLWVLIGVEAVVVCAARMAARRDVGRAMLLAVLVWPAARAGHPAVVAGVVPRSELAEMA